MTGLREVFDRLYAERGRLTPELVVEEAAAPDHPLHDRFEWDDAKAAHAHRLDQAERLIRRVKITREAPDDLPSDVHEVRAYHTVRDGTGYHPIARIVEDPVRHELLLRYAEREWRTLFAKYGHLREFIETVRADVAAEVVAPV